MLDDFKKSIQSVLYERITSPLSGAFLFSWLVWNWKFPYYLFFIDDKKEFIDKIKFIEQQFYKIDYNLVYPILSTAFLILIYPFISTGVLWVWLKFKKWQSEIKSNIEKQHLLTFEQSVELRIELKNQINRFNELLKGKDDDIILVKEENKLLKERLELFEKNNSVQEAFTKVSNNIKVSSEQYNFSFLLGDTIIRNNIDALIERITRGYYIPDEFPTEVLTKLSLEGIIEMNDTKDRIYVLTEKGKEFIKEYYRSK